MNLLCDASFHGKNVPGSRTERLARGCNMLLRKAHFDWFIMMDLDYCNFKWACYSMDSMILRVVYTSDPFDTGGKEKIHSELD